jgi:diguanylate cyclase (GGDEF)-like protein
MPPTVAGQKRLTIGVLFGFHVYEGSRPAPFSFPIIRGMQTAAHDKHVNILLSCGVARRTGTSTQRPAWPEVDPDTDFLPVGPWNTDGLVCITPLLTESRLRYVRRLVDDGFPILIVGGDAGYPQVVVDNEGGIRQVVEHLVGHGHRSIAFIAGYEQDTGDSAVRLNAYRKGVREFGLDEDLRLVEYGRHWDRGGYHAMQRLLRSGAKFTAVMCSNDHSAMGAMQALQEAGLSIPGDVAVTGFDDVLEAQSQVPPLTSVHFPLFETGYRSLLLLLKRIQQGRSALKDCTRVYTWLVPRQSCGCLSEMVTKSAEGGSLQPQGAHRPPTGDIDGLAQSMLNTLLEENPFSQESELLPHCRSLAEGFLESIRDGDSAHFLNALSGVLQQVEQKNENSPHVWQSAVTVLRLEADPPDGGEAPPGRAVEDMLHQARTLVSDSVDRRYTRLQVNYADHDENMGLLTARLISVTEEEQVYEALREDLPLVGVRSCNVVFFEPRGEDPVAVSALHPLQADAPVLRFETRQFPPPGLYPEGEPQNLAILPIFFQNERMGYAAFDGADLEPLAVLARQLASSIKNAQLHARVLGLTLSDSLTGVHNRRYFEIMLQKEVERSQRYRRDLAVIMIDIDNFKRYNDAFGHPAGDAALREIAQCVVRGAQRGLDVVTRYGGEEFAVILPETGGTGAWTVAENVRRLVEGNGAFLQPLTVSLGIAVLAGERIYPHMLLEQADRALYQAKHRGRNQTVLFEDWMREAAHFTATEDPAGPADSFR